AQGNVSVSLGKGDGTFQQGATLSVPGSQTPYALTVRDVNGDGDLDVELRTYVKTNKTVRFGCVYPPCGVGYVYHVYVHDWLGAGDGSFGPSKTVRHEYISATPPSSYPNVAYGDISNDGHRDGVVAYYDHVTVALGNSDDALLEGVDYPAGPSPISV